MTTIGEILLNARLNKKLTLDQVEKATKIRQKFLVAIEKNDFSKLPPGTFAKGFIKNYAAYLGLSAQDSMAFYRRQVNEEKTVILPTKNQNGPNTSRIIGSLTVTNISIIILIILFFGYITYSYMHFSGAPTLVVNTPAQNTVINTAQVEITGETEAESVVIINDQNINVSENGSFSSSLNLTPGLNTITIVAKNKFGKQTTVTRNVRLEK